MTIKSTLVRMLAIATLFLAVAFVLFGFSHSQNAHAGGQTIGCTDMTFIGGATTTTNGCSQTGSTTPLALTTGMSTTTMTVPTANATTLSLNLDVVPVSASTVYLFTVAYSNNGVDWFQEDANSTSGSVITHAASATIHTWTPGAATTTRSINIQTHAAKFTQIGFKLTGANGKLYPQAILQNAVVN
jgi:hypothetical protein